MGGVLIGLGALKFVGDVWICIWTKNNNSANGGLRDFESVE
jgi:hypothetical protein